GADGPGPQVPERPGHVAVAPRPPPERGRVHLQLDEMADRFERVAEEVADALHRPEQVADHREAAALDAGEVDGRPLGLVDAALDPGRLQVRVALGLQADEPAGPLQVVQALSQGAVAHALSAAREWLGVGAASRAALRRGAARLAAPTPSGA